MPACKHTPTLLVTNIFMLPSKKIEYSVVLLSTCDSSQSLTSMVSQPPGLANTVLQLLQPIDDRHDHANKLTRKQVNQMTVRMKVRCMFYRPMIMPIICHNSYHFFAGSLSGCGFPGAPAHSTVTFSPSDDNAREGTIAEYSCDR